MSPDDIRKIKAQKTDQSLLKTYQNPWCQTEQYPAHRDIHLPMIAAPPFGCQSAGVPAVDVPAQISAPVVPIGLVPSIIAK